MTENITVTNNRGEVLEESVIAQLNIEMDTEKIEVITCHIRLRGIAMPDDINISTNGAINMRMGISVSCFFTFLVACFRVFFVCLGFICVLCLYSM